MAFRTYNFCIEFATHVACNMLHPLSSYVTKYKEHNAYVDKRLKTKAVLL